MTFIQLLRSTKVYIILDKIIKEKALNKAEQAYHIIFYHIVTILNKLVTHIIL